MYRAMKSFNAQYMSYHPQQLNLQQIKIWKLRKPLYGLCDAGDYWNKTFQCHAIDDLILSAVQTDPAMYTVNSESSTSILGSQFDDIIFCRYNKFLGETKKTKTQFQSKSKAFNTFKLFGASIEKIDYGYHEQKSMYIFTLNELTKNASFNKFRTMQHKLAWISITRPDNCALENIISQGAENIYSQKHIFWLISHIKTSKGNVLNTTLSCS